MFPPMRGKQYVQLRAHRTVWFPPHPGETGAHRDKPGRAWIDSDGHRPLVSCRRDQYPAWNVIPSASRSRKYASEMEKSTTSLSFSFRDMSPGSPGSKASIFFATSRSPESKNPTLQAVSSTDWNHFLMFT